MAEVEAVCTNNAQLQQTGYIHSLYIISNMEALIDILINCPASIGTVLIFGPKFAAVLLFFTLSHFLPVFEH